MLFLDDLLKLVFDSSTIFSIVDFVFFLPQYLFELLHEDGFSIALLNFKLLGHKKNIVSHNDPLHPRNAQDTFQFPRKNVVNFEAVLQSNNEMDSVQISSCDALRHYLGVVTPLQAVGKICQYSPALAQRN